MGITVKKIIGKLIRTAPFSFRALSAFENVLRLVFSSKRPLNWDFFETP